ncbi:hypothetical protein PUN28_007894 [Cardiocondyla obscurior]|uniref:Uncharacterized protein n=1 Tax=Cardiocondyla obscurior TaxID=286306 RepID=A0AAW2FUT7_9HYME
MKITLVWVCIKIHANTHIFKEILTVTYTLRTDFLQKNFNYDILFVKICDVC